jgi:hypothetical protein
MFTSIDELKSFLYWCRENGVYHIELDTLKADIIPPTTNEDASPQHDFTLPPKGW